MSNVGLRRYGRGSLLIEILVGVFGLIFISPLILLIGISLKTTQQAYLNPFGFDGQLNWQSYVDAVVGQPGGSGSIGLALLHSAIITVCSVVILICLGSITAYALARYQSRWSNRAYLFFVVGVVIPVQLGLIPLYSAMRTLGLTNSIGGTIFLYVCLMLPVTIFLYSGFIRVLPREYEEASQVDGAGWARTFVLVVFPLLRPITGSTAILVSLLIWNDFFTQLIFLTGSDQQTLPVAIYSLASANLARWNVIFAGVIISIVPILGFFVFAQKSMIRGFTGGIRG